MKIRYIFSNSIGSGVDNVQEPIANRLFNPLAVSSNILTQALPADGILTPLVSNQALPADGISMPPVSPPQQLPIGTKCRYFILIRKDLL